MNMNRNPIQTYNINQNMHQLTLEYYHHDQSESGIIYNNGAISLFCARSRAPSGWFDEQNRIKAERIVHANRSWTLAIRPTLKNYYKTSTHKKTQVKKKPFTKPIYSPTVSTKKIVNCLWNFWTALRSILWTAWPNY